MGPSLLVWGSFTIVLVSGSLTDLCEPPPELRNAVITVPAYKVNTTLICACEAGFRRLSRLPYIRCAGTASHAAWDGKCQCMRTSRGSTGRVTQTPDRHKGRRNTTGQGQTQLPGLVDLSGHCREPPSWEHENSQRIYHFMVGQEIYYACAQGFRARGREPAGSVCERSCGKTRWTQPRLSCLSELSLTPEDAEPPPETPGNSTACPLPTTRDTAETAEPAETLAHTEEAVTKEWLVSKKYQIAVTCCAFLLVGGVGGVLLLRSLTWQHRWRKMRRAL